MNGGDWNDGMNNIKGESVWLGFFDYLVLKEFIKVCKIKKDDESVTKYEEIMSKLKIALNERGWDGKWYKRAFFENCDVIGSSQSDECKIDSISQSFSVISGAGDHLKCIQAMDSLDAYLVDKENMIIKLLTPPFDKTDLNPGYIKEYMPGVRENGGQYTHGAIWAILANCILGNKERALDYFRMINPIEHAKTKEDALRYKVEPYVVAADIYTAPRMVGRGGWTWYTGSSSWLFVAGLGYILGIKVQGDKLIVEPSISSQWDGYIVEYYFHETKYKIIVKNQNHKSMLNFKKEIQLYNDGVEHEIEIKP